MSAAPPPPRPTPACRRDPERWFDRGDRVEALADCLACPVRAWCAREALSCNASWGMWAGIWIDDSHDAAAPYLRAIANGTAAQPDSRMPNAGVTAAPPPPAPTILRRPAAAAPVRSVSAALLARSSGHCEVMAAGCRLSFDQSVSRRATGSAAESCCPAELFVACRNCADLIAGAEPKMSARSGYLLAAGRDAATVPFHWRGTQWVLLGRDGWLTQIGDDAQTA
jgi:hypothetical protein